MLEVDSYNFEKEVLKSDKPVMVDCYATWCSPCSAFLPVIEKVADLTKDKYKVVKLDIDEAAEIAKRFNIRTVPTLLVFKNGDLVKSHSGRTSIENVLKLFEDV